MRYLILLHDESAGLWLPAPLAPMREGAGIIMPELPRHRHTR
jgi:hypothetical protein